MIILNFHGVGGKPREMPEGEQHCWLETGFFGDILDRIKNCPGVQISVDDSNDSDHAIILPMLKARGLKAKFFVVADRIDKPYFLSKTQIRELCSAGMTVANHGMHHVPWKNLGPDKLREELQDAKKIIEEVTGVNVSEAACPYGSYGRNSLSALRKYGYATVYTSDGGTTSATAWLQSRNTVVRTDTLAGVDAMLCTSGAGVKDLMREAKKFVKRWR